MLNETGRKVICCITRHLVNLKVMWPTLSYVVTCPCIHGHIFKISSMMLDIKSTCKFETADIFTSLLLQKVLLQQSDTETYCPNLSEKWMKWYEGSAIKGL